MAIRPAMAWVWASAGPSACRTSSPSTPGPAPEPKSPWHAGSSMLVILQRFQRSGRRATGGARPCAGSRLRRETAGRCALVATELATNLLKHAGGGQIILRVLSGFRPAAASRSSASTRDPASPTSAAPWRTAIPRRAAWAPGSAPSAAKPTNSPSIRAPAWARLSWRASASRRRRRRAPPIISLGAVVRRSRRDGQRRPLGFAPSPLGPHLDGGRRLGPRRQAAARGRCRHGRLRAPCRRGLRTPVEFMHRALGADAGRRRRGRPHRQREAHDSLRRRRQYRGRAPRRGQAPAHGVPQWRARPYRAADP